MLPQFNLAGIILGLLFMMVKVSITSSGKVSIQRPNHKSRIKLSPPILLSGGRAGIFGDTRCKCEMPVANIITRQSDLLGIQWYKSDGKSYLLFSPQLS